tara:strand:- start:215 stop:367 length:153 start_codon:yes stop_codon:yes gene_type:complete
VDVIKHTKAIGEVANQPQCNRPDCVADMVRAVRVRVTPGAGVPVSPPAES